MTRLLKWIWYKLTYIPKCPGCGEFTPARMCEADGVCMVCDHARQQLYEDVGWEQE